LRGRDIKQKKHTLSNRWLLEGGGGGGAVASMVSWSGQSIQYTYTIG
jgi:hypothetical protein